MMRTRLFIPLLMTLAVCFLTGVTAPPQAVSLGESFSASLKRTETILIQDELLTQAEERYRQAKGGVLPTVTAYASYLAQEEPSGSINSSFFPSYQRLGRIGATQPLFRGLREFAGIRAAQGLVRAQQMTRMNAATLLYMDVVESHYNVLSLEQDAENLKAEIGLYNKRVRELKDRFRIGRSRESEVLTTEATISSLRSQVEQLQGQIQAAREVHTFLTGLPIETTLIDEEPENALLAPLPSYLSRVEMRPDLRAEKQRAGVADENILIARGAHLPSVDLSGNYYFMRSGSLQNVTWDVQVALSLPIYAGGTIQSRVREAASLYRQSELSLSQVRRRAEQEIRTYYETAQAARRVAAALKQATRQAERSYQAQTRDYRLGLVTNLDVLQALTSFQTNFRAYDRARFQAKQEFLKLEAAAALRPYQLSEESQ